MTTNQNPGLFGRLLGGLFGRGKGKSSTEQALDRAAGAPGDTVSGPEPRDGEAAMAEAADSQADAQEEQAPVQAPEPVAPIKTTVSANSAGAAPEGEAPSTTPKLPRPRAAPAKKPAAKTATPSGAKKKPPTAMGSKTGASTAKTSSTKPRKPSAPKP